jgi:hypothetical protein
MKSNWYARNYYGEQVEYKISLLSLVVAAVLAVVGLGIVYFWI